MLLNFPGTDERVVQIIGGTKGLVAATQFIIEKTREKDDPSRRKDDYDYKGADRGREVPKFSIIFAFFNWNHTFQVKILIPNNSAGMIIGKAGSFIQEISKSTGAFIEVSKKSPHRVLGLHFFEYPSVHTAPDFCFSWTSYHHNWQCGSNCSGCWNDVGQNCRRSVAFAVRKRHLRRRTCWNGNGWSTGCTTSAGRF